MGIVTGQRYASQDDQTRTGAQQAQCGRAKSSDSNSPKSRAKSRGHWRNPGGKSRGKIQGTLVNKHAAKSRGHRLTHDLMKQHAGRRSSGIRREHSMGVGIQRDTAWQARLVAPQRPGCGPRVWALSACASVGVGLSAAECVAFTVLGDDELVSCVPVRHLHIVAVPGQFSTGKTNCEVAHNDCFG